MGEIFAGPGFKTCSKVGCRSAAVATLGFDYRRRKSWLVDLKQADDPSSYDLCSVHVGRFHPPAGWESEDRREEQSQNGEPAPVGHLPASGVVADGPEGPDKASAEASMPRRAGL